MENDLTLTFQDFLMQIGHKFAWQKAYCRLMCVCKRKLKLGVLVSKSQQEYPNQT